VDEIFEHDFHVHTHHSVCATDKLNSHPSRMLERAHALGIKTIGFTDHFAQHAPYATPKWEGCGIEMIAALRDELRAVVTPVLVLIACEADVIDQNTLSIEPEFATSLDYVIVAASHFHLSGIAQPASGDPEAVAGHYLAMLNTALVSDIVSIIAHPFKTPFDALGAMDSYMPLISDEALEAIAVAARNRRIAMEINAHIGRDTEYMLSLKRFIEICKRVGVRFTYGGDAHHQKDLGRFSGIEQAITYLELDSKHFLTPNELMDRNWRS